MTRKSFAGAIACAAVLGAAALGSGASPAMARGSAEPGVLTYEVTMNGTPIGTETVTKTVTGDGLAVTVETKTEVNVLFLTFTYDHRREEMWQGDALVQVNAKTDDDGDVHELALSRVDASQPFTVSADGKSTEAPADSLLLTLWTDAVLRHGTVLSVIDGAPFAVSVKRVGEEPVEIGGKSVPAVRYSMTGDRDRELWYDENGELLKVTFVRKGYDIAFTRR